MPVALESPLLRTAGFRHGFSTREFDFHEESLELLLRLGTGKPYRVSQVHGARAIVAQGAHEAIAKEEADALVATSGAVLVRVADCVPVLLADSRSGAVAAVHAGWRGLEAGVVLSAFAVGATAGASFDTAAIGPCIGVCCFEVGDDVAARIAASSSGDVVRRGAGKPHVDLRLAARTQLVRLGLQNTRIDDVTGCTACEQDLFFSYRRDGASAGRQVGVIAARA